MNRFLVLFATSLMFFQPNFGEAQPQAYPVAVFVSQSGACADVGELSRRGLEIAVEDINQKGGVLNRPIALSIEDTMEDSSVNAVSAFKRLLLNKDIKLFIGPSCSPAGLAVAPIAALNKNILLVSPSVGVREFNESGDNIFKLWPYDDLGPKLLADFAIKKGRKKVGILSSQQIWEKGQGDFFEAEFIRLGGSVLNKFEPLAGEVNLRTEISKIIAAQPEVVFLSNYLTFEVAAKEFAKQGYRGQVLSSLMTIEKIKLAHGAFEGAITYGYPPATIEFLDKFKQKFGEEPWSLSADTAYDILKIYAEIVNKLGKDDVKLVKERLMNINDYQGASGNFSIDRAGGISRKPVLLKVEGVKLSSL